MGGRKGFAILVVAGLVAAAVAALAAGDGAALQNRRAPGILRLGETVEATLAAGEIGVYRIAVVASDYLRITIEQPGGLIVNVVSPTGEPVASLHRVEPLDRPERVSWIADITGEYRVELQSRNGALPSGPHRVRFDEQRGALPDDASRVDGERRFEAAERLRRERRAEPSRAAIVEYEAALGRWRSLGDERGEADALLGIGLTYRQLSENGPALDHYRKSLPLHRAAGDRWSEALTLENMALVYRTSGELDRAVDHYEQAIGLGRSIGDARVEAEALNGLARLLFELGNYQGALAHVEQVLQTLALGDRRAQAYGLTTSGSVYWTLGDEERAIEFFSQALRLRQEIGDRDAEASALANLAHVHLSAGRRREGLDHLQKALGLSRVFGNRRTQALILIPLGWAYQLLGDHRAAYDALTEALQLSRAIGERNSEGYALAKLALSEARLGWEATARQHAALAQSIMGALGDPRGETEALAAMANLEESTGNLSHAREYAEAALAIIEAQRTSITAENTRSTYLAMVRGMYELYVDVLMRLHAVDPSAGHVSRALHAAERARARSLLDALTEARRSIREGVAPDLIEREQDIRRRLNTNAAKLAGLGAGPHSEDQRTLLERELESLVSRYRDLEADIRRRSPRFATLTQPVPLTLQQIQEQVLDDKTLLLEYALGTDRSYLWAVSKTSMTAHELPGRAVIEEAARRTHELMQASHRPGRSAQARLAAAELSRLLLAPAVESLADRRLLIVPDGALQFVPFAALPRPAPAPGTGGLEPLVVHHEIVVLPSASVVPALRASRPERVVDRTVAILADPVLQPSDPRLPASVRVAHQQATPGAAEPRDLLRSATDVGTVRFERLRFTRHEAQAIAALAGKPECSSHSISTRAARPP